MPKKVVKFIDLFSGMGGIRLGFEQAFKKAGYNTKCVLTSEIKEAAIKAHELNFPGEKIEGDVTKIETKDIEDFDFLLAGFPCQAFSVAGKQRGFADTRGTLFFEVERILREKKPYGFILENVEGIIVKGEIGKLGSGAFNQCRSLRSIVLSDELTEIGASAFYCCYSLQSIKLPDAITRISAAAFYCCYSLQEITIPINVTEIQGSVFSGCSTMEHYYMMPTVPPTLENVGAFTGISETCKIYVPKGCLEAYQTAENWSTYADYMVEMEE